MDSRIKGAFRNRYWSFKLKHKVFVHHLLKDGGGVRICERTRLGSFELQIDVSAAVWCMEILQEILLDDDHKQFFRKYRGSNFVLLVEKYHNWKGVFLKVFKLANGNFKNIIIPRGSSKWGWKRMAVCLDNFVGKRFWTSKGDFRKSDKFGDLMFTNVRRQNGKDRESYGLFQRNYSYEDKSSQSVARGRSVGIHTVISFKRNWREAVIFVRLSASL